MTTEITIDQAGRVLIPKKLREELHLKPGDVLELESNGDDITIRPQKTKAKIFKEQGIWVFSSEPTGESVVDLIDKMRAARSRHVMGLDDE